MKDATTRRLCDQQQSPETGLSALFTTPSTASFTNGSVHGASVEQILCATDFSAAASAAADVAALLAAKENLPLHLVHCVPDWIATPDMPLVEPSDVISRQVLEAESGRHSATCENITTNILHGNASREIPSIVDRSTKMVVMGSTGKGRMASWLMGSTAQRVAESVLAPTLVVREAEVLANWLRGRPLRVLCAVDFTVSADAAVSILKRLSTLGGEVQFEAAYIANVDDARLNSSHTELESQEIEAGAANLERDVWERLHLALGDVPTEVHIRITNASHAKEFVKLGRERGADLLIVGSHQNHGLSRLGHLSFSRGVLAHAETNVLCVPLASYKTEFRVPKLRRVLVATALDEKGDSALAYAYSLLPSGGPVKVIHVCGAPSPILNPLNAAQMSFDRGLETARQKREAEEKLKDLLPRLLATSGVSTTSEVLVHLNVSAAICEEAERCGADAICINSSSPGNATAALFGSVPHRVIAHSHIPVFLVTPRKL